MSFPPSWLITGWHMWSRNCLPFLSTWVHPGFQRGSCCSCLMFCRSLFVLLSFFFWPWYCLSFFDFRLLITSLASSNSDVLRWSFIFSCFAICSHVRFGKQLFVFVVFHCFVASYLYVWIQSNIYLFLAISSISLFSWIRSNKLINELLMLRRSGSNTQML